MATYNKFQGFVGYLGLAQVNCNTDTFRVYLTNNAPSASGDDVLADLAEFAGGTGYTAGGEDVQNAYSEAAGVGTLTGTDVVWTAGAGDWNAFQYVVMYDDTHASNILIAWWDYGTPLTLGNGETFTVNFGANIFTLT